MVVYLSNMSNTEVLAFLSQLRELKAKFSVNKVHNRYHLVYIIHPNPSITALIKHL